MVKPKTDRRLRPIEKADLKLASKLALDPDDSPNRAVSRFAELGDQPPLRVLCGATIVAGAVNRDRTLFRTGLRMLAAHQFATLAKSLVKDVVDRSRPGEALDSRRYKMAPGTSKDHRLQSMPSGHSAGSLQSPARRSRAIPPSPSPPSRHQARSWPRNCPAGIISSAMSPRGQRSGWRGSRLPG